VVTAATTTLVIELWLSILAIVLLQVHCNPQNMYGEYISLHLELTYHILYYIEHSDVLKGQIKIR